MTRPAGRAAGPATRATWTRLAAKLRCLSCGGRDLATDVGGTEASPGQDGTLRCRRCGHALPVAAGMVDARRRLASAVERERQQWAVFAASEDWLAPPEEYLLSLPHPSVKPPGDTLNWDIHAWNFERMLERVDVRGQEVLDVGAGRCWSTRLLTERGAICTATDIMEHPTLGLGVGPLLFRHYGIYFDRVLCDMAELPFADGVFDMVWFSGALHHAVDLGATVSEAARVLRTGGRIVLVNEACGGRGAQEVCQPTGAQDGINEHEYFTWRYLRYLRRCGFREIRTMRDYHVMFRRPHRRLQRLWRPVALRASAAHRLELLLWGGVLCLTATRR